MANLDAALAANRAAVDALIAAGERSGSAWTTPRAPGKWSPSQVVEHVARGLEEGANVVSGARSKFPTLPGFLRPLIRVFFNRIVKKGTFPKAKTSRAFDPANGSPTPVDARVRVEASLATFEQACRARAGAGLRVESTVFGAVSVEDYVRFVELHTHHHRKQIREA